MGNVPGNNALSLLVMNSRADAAFYREIGVFDDFYKQENIPVAHAEGHDENRRYLKNPQDPQ